MSDSVTTSIDVAVSPEVAFDAFTRDIDAWYRVDPDTLPDITRTAALRFEPHAGGRLLDVHDLESGEGRELARITAWEPGRRLAFVDNEGTEVQVSFEPHDRGTRVTLTHRGLDRLTPDRAAKLRGSGWPALARVYGDHLPPNARPLAVALASLGLLFAIGGGLWLALTPQGSILASYIVTVLLVTAMVAIFQVSQRLARRWQFSRWQYMRLWLGLMALLCTGVFIHSLYRVSQGDTGALGSLPSFLLVVLSYWAFEQGGPAGGRSVRGRFRPDKRSFARRRPTVILFSLIVVGTTLATGLVLIDGELGGVVLPASGALAAILWLPTIVSRRREKQTLGFNPYLYLAVTRRLGEQNRRPEMLLHKPSKRPEYSGWYAYDSEQDEHSGDFVAWSLKDLIDLSPEAIDPLREGRGKWRWDQSQRAYTRVERPSDCSQPA